jgi:arylsulfatase A-like enzyme
MNIFPRYGLFVSLIAIFSFCVPPVGAMAGAKGGPAGPGRPNILFLFSDDHALKALGAYAGGDALIATPQLDRLAGEGLVFRNNFCANSICGPSRAAILTGKHAHVNGMLGNERVFDGSQPTLPKYLRAAGYQTAIVGKWHLVSEPTGFDYWKVLPGQGYYYNPDFRTPEGIVTIEGHSTDVITDEALAWLRGGRDPERPFFLMAQYKAPHRNWMPALRYLDDFEDRTFPEPPGLLDDPAEAGPPFEGATVSLRRDLWNAFDLKLPPSFGGPNNMRPYRAAFGRMTPEQNEAWDAAYDPRNAAFVEAGLEGDALERARYDRFIKDYLRTVRGLDDNIGRILDYLEESGLADNTLVVYSSDQGFYLGEHGMFDKRWMYETSFRMPLLVRWPGVTPPGREVTELTQNIDFAPTLLRAAGVPVPGDMQGVSLLPLLRDPQAELERRALYYSYHDERGGGVPMHEGIRTARFKLIYFAALDRWELYDLSEDPEERNNLADDPARAELLRNMKAEFRKLREHYRAPEPGTLKPGPYGSPAPYLGERKDPGDA